MFQFVVLMLILTFVLVSAYIPDFGLLNSELRAPMSDFRISERLELQMFSLWFLDF